MTTSPSNNSAQRAPHANQREAEVRIKRLIVVGSLVAFAGFFGLTATTDMLTNPDAPSAANRNVVTRNNSSVRPLSRPHVRTKSSS